MAKMIITPTRAGLVYECIECHETGDATGVWVSNHTCN